MSDKSYYYLCKELGVCPACGRKPAKNEIYCDYHVQKRREAQKRYNIRAKERMKEDPEFRAHRKAKAAEHRIQYREKCRAEKRCYACGKPATHGVYCTKHWMENVEKSSDHPYRKLMKVRQKLIVPQVSARTKVDVGKIIALYNAGWSYKKIEKEMNISHGTIGRYVHMAKVQMNDSENM